jgi:GNAT superfamily N-acetyltransferase
MPAIAVRQASSDDRPACVAIYARTKPLAVLGFEGEIDRALFDKDTEDELILVAERDGAIIGFAGYYEPGNFLHHLYVDPDAHGQGAGSALLNAVKAKATPGLTLKVQIANHRGRAFYATHGFSESLTGQDQYGPWVLCTAQ